MQCLIIDDDINMIESVKKKILSYYPESEIDSFSNVPDIVSLEKQYDLAFVDLMLDGTSGIKVAETLKRRFTGMGIVFISNQDHLIFQTQIVSPICFIRKTNLDEDFITFYALYEDKMDQELKVTFKLNRNEDILGQKSITLRANDIVYLECYLHGIIVHTHNDEFVAKLTLADFLKQVESMNCFIQVHRGYAVNMNYIYKVDKDVISMLNNEIKNQIVVSKKYKKIFKNAYEEFKLL